MVRKACSSDVGLTSILDLRRQLTANYRRYGKAQIGACHDFSIPQCYGRCLFSMAVLGILIGVLTHWWTLYWEFEQFWPDQCKCLEPRKQTRD